VRPMLVVPGKEGIEFPAKVSLALRSHDPASCLVFHGPDEAFDHGDREGCRLHHYRTVRTNVSG
jgi:hypothetical protein